MGKQDYAIKDIATIIGAEARLSDANRPIKTLLYDSRKITDAAGGLFFALKGNQDGHQYVKEVYGQGVRNFVVAADFGDQLNFPGANFLTVSDTLAALHDLAAYHRAQFHYPVIGITGSNGKTMVKEWLFQLLSPEYDIIRSPKSYNSKLGVPLSLWEMKAKHQLAIIEAGISEVGEMDVLERMIRPTHVVLTNIGFAHDDGFENTAEKIREKLLLAKGASELIYSSKYVPDSLLPKRYPKLLTWGEKADDDLQLLSVETLPDRHTRITASLSGTTDCLTIPFSDWASVENVVICWAMMHALGYTHQVIAERVSHLHPVNMRLELKKGLNNCAIIDDSYSNDLSSLAIALDFLKQQHQHRVHTLILSDFPNTDALSPVYGQLETLLRSKPVDRLITVGANLQANTANFDTIVHEAYTSTVDLIMDLPKLNLRDQAILLKGARHFQFETISRLLIEQWHETRLEINLTALQQNLNYYKSLVRPGVKLMAMVKAFSYGSGSFEVANLLQFHQVDYLAVAYVDEGVALRAAGITLPIMVMSPDESVFELLVKHRLEPEIYNLRVLHKFALFLGARQIEKYPIHIKLDTGMHRLGFELADMKALCEFLSISVNVVSVRSIFSHFVASGEQANDAFTKIQLERYQSMVAQLQPVIPYHFLQHIANTAGMHRWPEAHLDMVRLGIGMYGIGDDNGLLQQVGTLKTSVTQVKRVVAGDGVGYGRHSLLKTDKMVATVKIGYADGYDRRFGNGNGHMWINGQQVPTIGNICMDMCMLDVTGMSVAEGDEVVVFGDVTQLATAIGTIPYELITGVSQRVRRIYYYE